MKVAAHFDNSSGNPRRPASLKAGEVRWGEATTDEMCIGFIGVTKKGQDLTRPDEKDDLEDIFRAQVEGYRQRRDAARAGDSKEGR